MNKEHLIVTELVSMMTVHSAKGRQETMRCRKYYGLSFCIDGQITYTHGGVDYVSHPGCAILLPQGQGYTIRGDVAGRFPLINFRCASTLCTAPVVIPIESNAPYLALYERLRALRLMGGQELQMMSLFYELLHRLLTPPSSALLSPALAYIEQNFSDPHLTNATLAAMCNISEVYFRKLFTRQYHTSPRQWLLDFRIGKAKQLLREGNVKISAVAQACGFSGVYHFCRAFRTRCGMTPSEYMLHNKETGV